MRANGENTMKIELLTSYASKPVQIAEIERQIAETEEILKTPQRTVDDIIRHMQLLKERNSLI